MLSYKTGRSSTALARKTAFLTSVTEKDPDISEEEIPLVDAARTLLLSSMCRLNFKNMFVLVLLECQGLNWYSCRKYVILLNLDPL
jgi:hypothetical protein